MKSIERVGQILQGYRDRILTEDEAHIRIVEEILNNVLDDVESTKVGVAMGIAGAYGPGGKSRTIRIEVTTRPGYLSIRPIE